MFEGAIDDQGRLKKSCRITNIIPTLRSETHGNIPKAVMNVRGGKTLKKNDTSALLKVPVKMANTLDTSCNQGVFVQMSEELTVYAVWYPKKECYVAIRKLTPKECFRLQGWSDDYFEKAQFVNSDSQLYKQAGNGVTVSVIKAIAEKMDLESEVEQ